MKMDLNTLSGVTINETFEDGTAKSCLLSAFNTIETPFGTFVPQFTEDFKQSNRKKKIRPSVILHKNLTIKSLALDEQMDVHTPLGTIPAELVTFYDDGSLNRVFLLNGKLDGYWSAEDEGELIKPFTFNLRIGDIIVKPLSIRFDKDKLLKSITFWPGTNIGVVTPSGTMTIKNGVALYPSGELKSTEPAGPTQIETPIGTILASDPNAIGLHADDGSLKYYENGQIKGLTSENNRFVITDGKGKKSVVAPREIESYVGEEDIEFIPVKIIFDDHYVVFDNGVVYKFRLDDITVKIDIISCCCGGCSDCSSCG